MSQAGIELREVRVRLGGREVLDGVSLALEAHRIHALVGENGAGKSTLIRVACGLLAPDAGSVRRGDARLPPGDPLAAARAGVGVVHQHFMLVDPMPVLDNVALGVEPRRGPLGLRVDRDAVRRDLAALSAEHALPVDPDALVASLPVGVRQRVEILKVLYRGATTLLLDEPTAVLSPAEVRALLDTVRSLARRGAAVLFVSHKLDEVFAVADHVTVIHRGRVTLSRACDETSPEEVARAVVGGGELPDRARRGREAPSGEVVLELRGLSAAGLRDVSLAVRAGEVVGVAGVEGNGQRPLAEVIAGVAAPSAGEVRLGGAALNGEGVAARRRLGLRWIPEDRERRGLLPTLSVAENLCLGDPALSSGRRAYRRSDAEALARKVIERFDLRPGDPHGVVLGLSGGNQQKVLVGRELAGEVRALVAAQPTRGVDLGASARIHAAIREARDAGAAVLLISSELDELRALSDRLVVMRGGAIVATLRPDEASDEALGAHMIGA